MLNTAWWKIKQSPDETAQKCGQLKIALENNQEEKVVALLKEPGLVRSFGIRRGTDNSYIKILMNSYKYIMSICKNGRELILFIHKNKISEYLIWEYMTSAHRLYDQPIKDQLKQLVIDNEKLFKDNSAKSLMIHELASWSADLERKYELAIELNKKAIALAKKGPDKIVPFRIKFGLSDHKGKRDEKTLRPQERIIDFKKYSKNFRAYCDEADALRADVEVAAALFDQAKKSPAVDQDKYLLQALSLAKNIHSQGKKFAYPNVVIIAKELLGAIASVSNKEEMSKKYYKEAEKLRASYNYHASNSYRFSQD